jgi:hypothetical protein
MAAVLVLLLVLPLVAVLCDLVVPRRRGDTE